MSLGHSPANEQATNEHEVLPPTIKGRDTEHDKHQVTDEHQMLGILAVGETAIEFAGEIAHETIEETEQMARSIVRWLDEQSKKYL